MATKRARGSAWHLLCAGLGTALRDAVLLTVACGLVGLSVNAWIHPRGIPLLAEQEYETLVPCPEPGGAVTPLLPGGLGLETAGTILVDARTGAEFAAWHLAGALNVAFDYLDPTPPEVLADLARRIARSRATRVVVYGDGDDPDSGEQLAREISASGIRNVHFVRGGARALRPAGEEKP